LARVIFAQLEAVIAPSGNGVGVGVCVDVGVIVGVLVGPNVALGVGVAAGAIENIAQAFVKKNNIRVKKTTRMRLSVVCIADSLS
jgi:hypothetical protein